MDKKANLLFESTNTYDLEKELWLSDPDKVFELVIGKRVIPLTTLQLQELLKRLKGVGGQNEIN